MSNENDLTQAKAALADKVFAGGYMDYYVETMEGYRCLFCNESARDSEMIDHPDHCPKREYEELLAEQPG